MTLPDSKVFASSLIVLSLLFSACGRGSKAETNVNISTQQPAVVQTTLVQATVQNVPTYFEATGNLSSDAQADVAPTIGGKVTEVNFDIGSYVQKGDVLIRIDARDAQLRLEQARSQANQAQAQVEQVKSTVKQAEAGVEQARANLRQQQSRLGLTQGDNFSIESFPQVAALRAQLEFAEKELIRAERLLVTGDVSRSFRDQKLAVRDQLAGQLNDARLNAAAAAKAIGVAAEGVRAAQAQVGTAQANVRSAQAAYNTALTGVEQAQKAVGDTAVYAPFSGYIAERNADLGEFISPNVPNAKIATIVRTSVLRLRIDVPEQSIGQVKVGQGISMQTSAYPDRNFSGIVTRISPSINPTSRVLVVEAEVENVDNMLKPGQFATVRITQSAAKPTVMVPTAAVKTEGETNKVYVVKDGRAEERIVKVGILENDRIEIQNGVQEGETVAVSNLPQLNDGVMVQQ